MKEPIPCIVARKISLAQAVFVDQRFAAGFFIFLTALETATRNFTSNESYQLVTAQLSSLVSHLSCRGASIFYFAILIR